MRGLLGEYADLMVGSVASAAITGMIIAMILPTGIIYQAVSSFVSGIC